MLKDAIDLAQVKRVLVIKLRHHGDVLLSSPVFTVLKNHAPHVEIDALVYHDTREMITLHPAVSEVLTIDRNWKKLGVLGQLRAEWPLRWQLGVFRLERPSFRGAAIASIAIVSNRLMLKICLAQSTN